jgi:hypothetical protein
LAFFAFFQAVMFEFQPFLKRLKKTAFEVTMSWGCHGDVNKKSLGPPKIHSKNGPNLQHALFFGREKH